MKLIIFSLLCFLVSGCATMSELKDRFQRGMNSDHMTTEERAEAIESRRLRREKEQEAMEARNSFIQQIVPGMSKSSIDDVIGSADRIEYADGQEIDWHDDRSEPFFLKYDSAKILTSKLMDIETVRHRELLASQGRQNRQTQSQLDAIRRQQAAQSFQMMSIQNQQSQPQQLIQIPTRYNNYNGQGR